MLSLEKPFREKLAALYRSAPLDVPSFHRKYKACGMGECAALCCNGGSGFYMTEESDTIRTLVQSHRDFFEKQGVPISQSPFTEEVDEDTGAISLCTNTRDVVYPPGLLPPHFPSTACMFRRDDGACTLQVLSVEQGKPSWWFKPIACWLFPVELEYDGKPYIRVAHASTDEYIDDEYPGFTGFTKCGAECAEGKPAYQVLEHEIAALSDLLERDLMKEILAYKETT